MTERSVFDPEESLVTRVFKGAAGGVGSAVVGMGAASLDGMALAKRMFVDGMSVSEALSHADFTKRAFKGMESLTGLPTNEADAMSQLGPGGSLAFILGQSFSPTRGTSKRSAATKTVGNTGINLGIEGLGNVAGEPTAMAISMIPGLGNRSAREALASHYAGKLTQDQIDRIKNGTITLAEITNDPGLMATQRRLQADPATAGRFQEFDRNAANVIEGRLQAATPRPTVQTGGGITPGPTTPSSLVNSIYKAYEKQTENLKKAKEAMAERDFTRVKANIDPDAPILDAQGIVDTIDKQIAENLALKQTDDVKATVAGLQRLRENFFERGAAVIDPLITERVQILERKRGELLQNAELNNPAPPELIRERIQLLTTRRNELAELQANEPSTQRALAINSIDRQIEGFLTNNATTSRDLAVNTIDQQITSLLERGEATGQRPEALKKLSVNEIQAQLSQWSGKMHTGDGMFEGATPTQSKRIASEIFSAYKNTISEAIKNSPDANIRDALTALETARKNYKTSLDRMDVFQERELSKYFGNVDNVATLASKPDEVMERISKLSPVERQTAFNIVRKNLPDGEQVIQGLRAKQWENMIEQARVKGGSDTSVRFDINKFLGEMDKADERLLLDMIPDPVQRASVRDTLAEMRIMARRNDWSFTEKGSKPGVEAVGAVAQATGVRTVVAGGIVNIMNDIKTGIIGPDRLLNMILHPEFKGRDFGEKALNFTKAVTKVATPTPTDFSRALRPAADMFNEAPEAVPPAPPPGFFEEGEDTPPPPPPGFFGETPAAPSPESELATMKVAPETQAQRDQVRKELIAAELQNETDPALRAVLERELGRLR